MEEISLHIDSRITSKVREGVYSESEVETVGSGKRSNAFQALFAADGKDVSGMDKAVHSASWQATSA